jgi:hypothetical protein
VPRGDDRSSAEGEERFGAPWNGLTNESLAAPPVRHHGPGVANADAGCSQTPTLQPVHQPSSQKRGLRAGFAQTATLAQVCQPLRRKVLRCAGQRYRLATVAWVLHD